MFKLIKDRKVWWPVIFQVAVDGGQTEESTLDLHFTLFKQDELDDVFSSIGDGTNADQIIKAHLFERVDDWGAVGDVTGEPLPFTQENFAALLSEPGLIYGAWQGLLQASQAIPVKN